MPYRRVLVRRLQWVEDKVGLLESRLAEAPEGKLQLSLMRGVQRPYMVTDRGERRYLGAGEDDLAGRLAQKEYDARVLDVLERERKDVARLLRHDAPGRLKGLYESLPDARKSLVEPVLDESEDFRARWEAEGFEGKAIAEEDGLATDRGELVRSKSEVIIANALFKANIPYRYEAPLHVAGLGKVHPDFTVLNPRTCVEFYWEHFGMMDDVEYANRAVRKMEAYFATDGAVGRRLIVTMETAGCVLDARKVQNRIEQYLM